jgi:hypothetical protein
MTQVATLYTNGPELTGSEQLELPRVSDDEARLQLIRILGSPEFQRSEVLGKLLHFIVDRTLKGDTGSLKEYCVAIEVFERPSDFDPRNQAVVRVEATRLRRKLDRYYRESGSGDAVWITIPKGRYVAKIGRRSVGMNVAPEEKREPGTVKGYTSVAVL